MENQLISSTFLMMEIGVYWVVTVLVITILDLYAVKKLGGMSTPGYQLLRGQKMILLMVASLLTITAFVLGYFKIIQISRSTLTYFGIPYFMIWVYFLVNVLRRVKAETQPKKSATITIRTPPKRNEES